VIRRYDRKAEAVGESCTDSQTSDLTSVCRNVSHTVMCNQKRESHGGVQSDSVKSL
jgi:hypothetical protein